ncbi:BON domain-containing protein [Zavarzinella formosa]|uniref:BON domain-containing protein n=1 Tax=Zavarzinella formosa TaxID=360055 RepID=UPI0002F64F6C|nr:BON domain-containing protein [Zavarzinella formosa]
MIADSTLPAAIAPLLHDNPVTCLRRLDVTETHDEVVITGHVSTYYLKQLAQETVRPALGGRRLRNQVKVVSSGWDKNLAMKTV